ncbi:MAG: 50S ribosomal protein L3 [Nitrososphaerales archaeon]
MGHRKHSAPRRGSLAYYPRKRAASVNPVVRTWSKAEFEKPTLLGYAGFKVGMTSVVTVDDREKTPNFGKPAYNASTVVVTPRITIIGIRYYTMNRDVLTILGEAYSNDLPKDLERAMRVKPKPIEEMWPKIESRSAEIVRYAAIVHVSPKDAGLAQKKPYIFEIPIGGGDKKAQLDYLKSVLGKSLTVRDVFVPGNVVDVISISRGQGFEGPVTRFGIKRLQHKSRKSVRAVGTIGAWSPAAVMWTVPRAGQHGFHQRVESNKRLLAFGTNDEARKAEVAFPHFGVVKGDFLVVKGSIAGPPRRFLKMRFSVRGRSIKTKESNIVEVSDNLQLAT